MDDMLRVGCVGREEKEEEGSACIKCAMFDFCVDQDEKDHEEEMTLDSVVMVSIRFDASYGRRRLVSVRKHAMVVPSKDVAWT